jgi:transposase
VGEKQEEARMQYIAFDSHKKYTLARVEAVEGGKAKETRIRHEKGSIRDFLCGCHPGSSVAVETIGNWYWIVEEIEAAGMRPLLVHARKAKMMMGMINKTDRLDAAGLNRLQRSGTLPTVWIPPQDVRDKRELLRARMDLVAQRTQLKNRIHAALARYGIDVEDAGSDVFRVGARENLEKAIQSLPPQTSFAAKCQLDQLDALQENIARLEERIKEVLSPTPEVELLMTMPGVGLLLGSVIALEIGDVSRFPRAENLASYAGTTPRVDSSGGKTRYGQVRGDVNRFLKWAFAEAANAVCRLRAHYPYRHVSKVYERIRAKKNHAKAIGAVSRHLAEASYWILTKKEPYKERDSGTVSSKDA